MFRSNFEKLLDKVTSNLLLEPDWPSTLEICDTIRQKDVQPKFALSAIKKKLSSPNPHTAMYSLLVLECCVKNCGQLVHDEVGTKPFMEQMRDTIKTTPHENVKNKLLELLQTWAFAFRAIPKYCAVQDTVNIMKAEGYTFPALKESDAMFSSDVAPGWEDSDCCHRCRVKFGMVQRKHHCRACGQVFCAQCSSRSCTLPKFGIEKPVRVCEACFEKSHKPLQMNKGLDDLPIEYLTSSLAQQNQVPVTNRKTEEELREDEELQLALALSQSEAEQQKVPFMNLTLTPATGLYSSPPVVKEEKIEAEEDPELARYLNRSYWENRTEQQAKPAQYNYASPNVSTVQSPNTVISPTSKIELSEDSEEMELFITSVKSQLEIFVNRIKSNLSRGRTVINGGSLETFYSKITPMHQKLLQYIQQQDEKRLYFERLQDKLVQIKDTRAALDAMRDDHKTALQQEAAYAEQQRKLQLAMKLDVLRLRKQQYQQYQHQMTLQQVQQQEQEMALRMEHQRQSYLNNSMYGPSSLPSVPTAPTPYMSTGSNSLMSTQMQENGIRYPQSADTGGGHFQHISQPQGFVGRHMIPPNQNSIPISQPGNLPSNESNHLAQANPNISQSIYQPRMAPMTGAINSGGIPISTSMVSSVHQQPLPGVIGGPHVQPAMPSHQQPQLPPNMGQQHVLPVGQPMMPGQHQPPMMSPMPYHVAPVHMGQYGTQQIPSQQVNPQPSAPNQVEQVKVEQLQVAELISFD